MKFIIIESKNDKQVKVSDLYLLNYRLKGSLDIIGDNIFIKYKEVNELLNNMYWIVGKCSVIRQINEFIFEIQSVCNRFSFDSNRLCWNLENLKKLWEELIHKVRHDYDCISEVKLNDSLLNVMASKLKDVTVKKQSAFLKTFFESIYDFINNFFINNYRLYNLLSISIENSLELNNKDEILKLKPKIIFSSDSINISYHLTDIINELFLLLSLIKSDLELLKEI